MNSVSSLPVYNLLLPNSHICRILMRISVETNLVTCITDCSHLFGESLERMARNEPCGFDVILV